MTSPDPGAPREVHNETELAASLRTSDRILQTKLRTNERVLARVTDGIYRQPASALRELISNAYDADATQVVINTDRPRFERISVHDNGHGMSPETVAHLLFNIGGSAKRSDVGQSLGITDADDPTRSPGGRRLIGKIGIGLFSVSQLTHAFQIITKVKGDAFRTVATVALRQYSEGTTADAPDADHKFESGKVNIWKEHAADPESHGTTIVLTAIRSQARDTLRSRDIWSAIEQNESAPDGEDRQTIEAPKYHIGRVDRSGKLLKKSKTGVTSLPWAPGDPPADAFSKLVQCVWAEVVDEGNPNPQLNRLFDYYLRMVWQLSLAVPLPYVEGHLFDMDLTDWAKPFELSNDPKGAANAIDVATPGPIRHKLSLADPVDASNQFEVLFDDLRLLRPIKFRNLPATSHALKYPLVFIGKCREEFPKVARELSGGPLAFEAYLFWTPKVAPTEHQGSLVRIHGSSGTLFDPTFMRYQVSEQTRLRQITCEIFVTEGLEAALNIDRESFNNAHPHSIYITNWLHSALRQLASMQKRLASEVREETRGVKKEVVVSDIQRIALSVWREQTSDPASSPPAVHLAKRGEKRPAKEETYVFERSEVVQAPARKQTPREKKRAVILEEKLKAAAQVLAAFGLLDKLTTAKQEQLLRAIYEILQSPGE
jgi:Histidine kinase-, DNA gyrase B-, and HSP90-like ATPase